MARTLDQLDEALTNVETTIGSVGGKVDTTLQGITEVKEQIKFVYDKVTEFEAKVDTQNLAFGTQITGLLDERQDYQELWKAQKREADAIENLRQHKGDPEIQALLSMKGLDVLVSRSEIAKLQGDKAALKKALEEFPRTRGGKYAGMLANLGYAYALMAQHYKIAREHVTAVIAEKTAAEIFLSVTLETLKAAVAAGLSALTGGVTGIISDALVAKAKLSAASGDIDFKDEDGNSHKAEVTEKEDKVTGRKIGEAVVSSPVEGAADMLGGALGATVGNIGGLNGIVSRASQLFSTEGPENETKDPYDFFLEKEAQLRRAAAMLANCTDPELPKNIKVELDREYSIEELEEDPNWKYFFEVHSNYGALDKTWEQVSALLAANMRRLCWRLFCRSQWNNVKYSYTVTVHGPDEFRTLNPGAEEDPASEWHYKTWAWSGLGWPRHWEKICSDFRGPEHDPDHPFTVQKGLVNKAHKLLAANAWISMAAVQCCQIKRHDAGGIGQNWAIDLEKYGHVGGEEGERYDVPRGWTDEVLVYGNIRDAKFSDPRRYGKSFLEDFLVKIRVQGGTRVQLSEIRFGKGGADVVGWTKATGKKGRLSGANTSANPIPILKGMKITALVKRIDEHGNSTTSRKHAWANVFKAPGPKHDGATACDRVKGKQLCWYCAHCSPEEIASEKFKEYYKLVDVDRGEQQALIISNAEVNYMNFPSVSTAAYVNEPGLYCIKLHPRRDLQTASGGEFHVTDEWWFKILNKAAPADAPETPTIPVSPAVGATEISGEYKRRADTDPPKTLIHVFVNDKMYGPKEIDKPADANAVDWKIEGIDKLCGGERIYATATWPGSGVVSARQSDPPAQAVLVSAASPDIHLQRLLGGATWVGGVSTAGEGATIRVYVGDVIDDSTVHVGAVKLVGDRFDQTEVKAADSSVLAPKRDGVIRWEITGLPPIDVGKKVAARVYARGMPVSARSNPVVVQKAAPPVINDLKPGAIEIGGTADTVPGLQVLLEWGDSTAPQKTWSDIGGPRDASGLIPWIAGKSTPFPPLKPGQKVVGEIGYVRKTSETRGFLVSCSDKSAPKIVEKLADKPVVNAVSAGCPISGTAKLPGNLFEHSEVWVKTKNAWLPAAATATYAGDAENLAKPDIIEISWEIVPGSSLVLTAGTDTALAQIFGKPISKGADQEEFSELSDPKTAQYVEKPVVSTAAVNGESITGTARFVTGASIKVKVDGKELANAAEITTKNPKQGDPIDWKITNLKAVGTGIFGSAERLVAGKKAEAALFVGTTAISEWGEKVIS